MTVFFLALSGCAGVSASPPTAALARLQLSSPTMVTAMIGAVISLTRASIELAGQGWTGGITGGGGGVDAG